MMFCYGVLRSGADDLFWVYVYVFRSLKIVVVRFGFVLLYGGSVWCE